MFILAHLFRFVNRFFQIISKLFDKLFKCPAPKCLHNIAPETSYVNTFFEIFSSFFRFQNLVVQASFKVLNSVGLLAEETAYVRQRLHLAVGRVARSLKNKIDTQQLDYPAEVK